MHQKRKQVIIKNQFQRRLILSTLLITLISLNLIILTATLLDRMYGDEGALINVFTISIALMEVLTIVVVFFISRKISFHIAGPVYAIERTLASMREGDVSLRLKLREGDNFSEVAEAINEVLETYQQRFARIQGVLKNNPQLSQEQQNQLMEELSWFTTEREE